MIEKKISFFPFIKKNGVLILILGFFVAGFLFFGDIFSDSKKEKNTEDLFSFDEGKYIESQEKKLREILMKIDGVGICDVMMSVSGTCEYVYAQDKADNANGENTEYIILNNSSGDSLVTLTVMLPKIKGVAVVCAGGGSSNIKNEITEIVCKMYGLTSAEVYISKHK